ncbi:hypothetical protein BDZ45DRAFT_359005 [Acephala macrosclerotiorum]|nr:hypothetical protein BDZ45DRAFT_359005 [Acephala macrosclerotiorum]
MFNGSFEEATTQRATLSEDDPVAFKLIIGWVYTRVIEIPKYENEESPVTYFLRLLLRSSWYQHSLMEPLTYYRSTVGRQTSCRISTSSTSNTKRRQRIRSSASRLHEPWHTSSVLVHTRQSL